MKIILDLETIQAPKETWRYLSGVSEPVGMPSDEEVQRDADLYEKSSFDGTYAQIVCIGALVIPASGAIRRKAWYGEDEAALLAAFWKEFATARPSLLIGHNILGFDWPMLHKRSVIHHLKPTLSPNLARFRTDPIYDTMEVWANWDPRNRVKLDVLARALNVPAKTGLGSQVADKWAAGLHREVADYCLADCYTTYAVYSRMTFQSFVDASTLPEASYVAGAQWLQTSFSCDGQ